MKEKVKNASRKLVTEEYQRQVQKAIDEIKARDGKLSPTTKDYLKVLEKNIELAPYVLGYLHWPEEKKKKGS